MSPARFLAIALTCCGLAACVSSSTTSRNPDEPTASELYVRKGLQYMENGRLDVAQQDLQRAIELDSSNAEAHNAMGVLQERLRQIEVAEEHFRKALSLDDKNPSAANNLGRLLCANGEYEQAMKLFKIAIDSTSYQTPWLALTNIGLCAHAQGQLAEAENYLRRALDYNPTFPPALLDMAKLSLESKNPLSARAFLERYNAVADPTAESLAIGIQAEQAMGNPKEAANYQKKLLRFFPKSKEAQRFGGPSH